MYVYIPCSLCHAESYAIDLMWDIVARFAGEDLPRDFYEDWSLSRSFSLSLRVCRSLSLSLSLALALALALSFPLSLYIPLALALAPSLLSCPTPAVLSPPTKLS
jgi:hypothetical protein